MKYLVYTFLLFIGFISCSNEEAILENDDLIFTNSYPIRIPSYEYTDVNSGIVYKIKGDSSYYSLPDTFSSNPEFRWTDYGIKILSVAIFTNPIQVSHGEISNTEDIIWQWHTGMDSEKNDTTQWIQYNAGKPVVNGEINYNMEVSPLQPSSYYWAGWGWNSSGTRIILSSRALEFYVSNE